MGWLRKLAIWGWQRLTKSRFPEEPQSAGMLTTEEPDPTDPPYLCAWEAEQVDRISQELQAKLIELQTAVEALEVCESSTIPPASLAADVIGQKYSEARWSISKMFLHLGNVKRRTKR